MSTDLRSLSLRHTHPVLVALLLLTCPPNDLLQSQDLKNLSLRGQTIVLDNGEEVPCEPVPDFLLAMVEAGGLLPSLKRKLSA